MLTLKYFLQLITSFLLLVSTLVMLDLGVGHFFVPYFIKKTTNGDINEYFKTSSLHPYYNHGFKTKATGVRKFGPFQPIVYTNSLGLLDSRIRDVDSISNKRRILFIGDSFVEGVGLPYPKTFAGIIKDSIDSSRIEILNAGSAGYSPKLYFLRTKYLIEIQKIIPKEIFCFVDYSDFGDELVYEDFTPSYSKHFTGIVSFLRRNSILFNAYHLVAKQYFLRKSKTDPKGEDVSLYWVKTNNSFIYKYPDYIKVRHYWISDDSISEVTLSHAQNLATSNIDSLKNICDENKIKLHVVVYPPAQLLLVSEPHKSKLEIFWKNYCQSRNIDFINLCVFFFGKNAEEAAINKSKYYIKDNSHWNEEGHKIVAQKILPLIN